MTERQRKPEERIIFLEAEVQRHRDLYYNEQPEISDAKFIRKLISFIWYFKLVIITDKKFLILI